MPPPRPDGQGPSTTDERLAAIVAGALAEDIGAGDITTELTTDPDSPGSALIRCKEGGVVAGTAVASLVFARVDPSLATVVLVKDGATVAPGDVVMRVSGRGSSILKAERTALNFLQRMSGIATLTSAFVRMTEGTRAKITDTRKTAPGLRLTDKLAVRAGGGVNHRSGLYDMVLIKDNHIAAAGGIGAAVSKAAGRPGTAVEVETKNLDEVAEALRCPGITRIMLDNFGVDATRDAVRLIGGRLEVEASGNVSLANVRAIAGTGVDFISVGALTQSAPALDLSLDYAPGPSPP